MSHLPHWSCYFQPSLRAENVSVTPAAVTLLHGCSGDKVRTKLYGAYHRGHFTFRGESDLLKWTRFTGQQLKVTMIYTTGMKVESSKTTQDCSGLMKLKPNSLTVKLTLSFSCCYFSLARVCVRPTRPEIIPRSWPLPFSTGMVLQHGTVHTVMLESWTLKQVPGCRKVTSGGKLCESYTRAQKDLCGDFTWEKSKPENRSNTLRRTFDKFTPTNDPSDFIW